jgi:hypothetical protein
MGEDREFLLREILQIEKTLGLITPLLSKEDLDQYQIIALGTLLQNAYTGIENILRGQLQSKGIKLPKTANWHKDLLRTAHETGLVNDRELPVFRNLLLYRHRHIHGYGHMLDEVLLVELAKPVPEAVLNYLDRVRSTLG